MEQSNQAVMHCEHKDAIFLSHKSDIKIVIRETEYKYGMITDKATVSKLKLNGISFLFCNDLNVCANLVFVIDICVYVLTNSKIMYEESNDSLAILSSQDCFWCVDEIEHKIETLNKVNLLSDLRNTTRSDFSFSDISSETCFERYYEYRLNEKIEYIAILGKRNWKRKRAIKHKKFLRDNPLTRRVHILDYHKLNGFLVALFGFIDTNKLERKKLLSYYKKKERVVCLDRTEGILYGVSFSQSKPLRKDIKPLNQIEIEFWSFLKPRDELQSIAQSNIFESRFHILVDCIANMISEDIIFPAKTKIEWIKEEIHGFDSDTRY